MVNGNYISLLFIYFLLLLLIFFSLHLKKKQKKKHNNTQAVMAWTENYSIWSNLKTSSRTIIEDNKASPQATFKKYILCGLWMYFNWKCGSKFFLGKQLRFFKDVFTHHCFICRAVVEFTKHWGQTEVILAFTSTCYCLLHRVTKSLMV